MCDFNRAEKHPHGPSLFPSAMKEKEKKELNYCGEKNADNDRMREAAG